MTFGLKTNERPGTRAELKYARFSAFKAREVLNIIRGRSAAEAQAILDLTERGAAEPILKLLNSAIANAEHNDGIGRDELFVSACFADEGPTLKRFRPRARGRAGRINKRTCHVTIIVSRYSPDELEALRAQEARRGAAPGTAASRARRVAGSRKSGEPAVTESKVSEDTAADETVTDSTASDAAAETATDATIAPLYDPADGDAADSDKADGDASGAAGPHGPGSHAPLDDPAEMPEGYPIKGNADSMLYHPPESPFYGRTIAEVWFDTAESAEAAGFSLPPSMAGDDDSDEGEK